MGARTHTHWPQTLCRRRRNKIKKDKLGGTGHLVGGAQTGGLGGRDAALGARRLKRLKVMRQSVRAVADGGAAGCRGRAMCTLLKVMSWERRESK